MPSQTADVIPFHADFVIMEDPAERSSKTISCAIGEMHHAVTVTDSPRRLRQLDLMVGQLESMILDLHNRIAQKRNSL